MICNETRLRVRYAETDKMGVVYHSHYLIWMEVGRAELMRQHGFDYRSMEKQDNCHLPVVDVHIRYKAPAYYDDEILVRTHMKNTGRSLLRFGYQILRQSGEILLAEGETTHMIVDDKLQRSSLPEKYQAALGTQRRKVNS
ncbi:MAG TPA: thioesterase family protein [Candidatus Angelobacter sp.]|nr:thioesterase family protein [Candidatus Angelobacter sp.]